MSRLIATFRHHPLLSSAFALALAATLFFAVRTAMFAIYWADPAHRDQAIQGWMTPGYVAHSWHVPREVMANTLGVPHDQTGIRKTLAEIAAEQDIPLAQLIAQIQAAVAAHRMSTGQ